MGVDAKTLAASKKYTDTTVAGGGAIKGKNCTVDSITPITGGNRVTFKWTLDNGTVQTAYIDVMDGATGAQGPQGIQGPAGASVSAMTIDAYGHLIITFDDGTIQDAGPIPGGSGAVDSVNSKTGIVVLTGEDIATESGSSDTLKLSIDKLKASDLALRVAIQNLDLLVASKVDKVAGKGLSTNDYTDDDLAKLRAMLEIKSAGSGLNFDPVTGELTATGAAITIDPTLDPTSPNAIQNRAVAIPIAALQGSMANVQLDVSQLQGSMANKADKSEITNIQLDISQLQGSMANAKTDIGNLQLDVTHLQGSIVGMVKDPNYVHTDNNYTDTDKAAVQQIPLDIAQLQGSVLSIQLDVDHLTGSVLPLKADKADLDEFTPDAYANANGEFYFDNLDDSLGYKFCGWDRLIRIERWTKTDPDPLHAGKVAVTYKTDAPLNTRAALRILK